MARGSSVIAVRITGDNRDLKRALDDSGSRIGSFASTAGRGLRLAGTAIAGAGIAAAIAGPKLLDMGNTIEAMGVKSATVFGDSLGDVEAWSAQVAGSMGLTQSELTATAANMGDLLKPMGFTESQAAAMSTEMVDLSGALSAWTGGTRDAAEVSDILSKAMLGERDGLKSLGISITEADVAARLAADGTAGLTGEALAQAKALATQALILEKSTDAQTAWNDGSMDGIKASNEAKAGIEELKESVIRGITPALQALVPWVTKAATWIGENLAPVIKDIAAWVQANWPGFRDTMVNTFNAIRDAVQTAWTWIDLNVLPIVQRVFAWVSTEVAALVEAWRSNWDSIKLTIQNALKAVRIVVEKAIAVVQAAWEMFGDTILEYVASTWDNIKQVISGALNVIQGIINTVTALIRGDWGAAWDGIKQVFSGAWEAITGVLSQALNAIRAAISAAMTAAGAAISAGWEAIKSGVSSAIGAVVQFHVDLPGRILGVVTSMASAGLSLATAAGDALKNAISGAIDDVVSTVTGLPGLLLGVVTSLGDAGRSLGTALLDGFGEALSSVAGFAGDVGRAVLNAVKDLVNTQIIDRINDTLEFTIGLPFGRSFTVNPPDLPRLHSGGPVGELGGPRRELPYILEQGEFVLSRKDVDSILRGGGRSGPLVGTINVIDGRDLTRELARVQALEAVAA